jgi:hypothetical protein
VKRQLLLHFASLLLLWLLALLLLLLKPIQHDQLLTCALRVYSASLTGNDKQPAAFSSSGCDVLLPCAGGWWLLLVRGQGSGTAG